VTHLDQLIAHFHRGSKTGPLRIGLEHEKIGFALDEDGGVRPIPYADKPGRPQIRALFAGLCESCGCEAVLEGGNTIALKRNDGAITLEPGGQFELSARAFVEDTECASDLDEHLRELLPLAERLSIAFVGVGFRPLGTWDDVPWMPKGRYKVMREYLPTRGKLGVEMMKRTATVQANLDYVSEADGIAKMRLGVGLGPLVTALYAASPLVDGKPTDYKSYRAHCWLDTDNDRCGVLPFLFREGAGFRDYAEWALDVPLFFVYRHGTHTPAGGMTFRRFMAEGFQGEMPTLADWETHLSTLFPDARLKQYVELRTADAGPLEMIRALPSLWRGLFYSQSSLEAAWQLVADLTTEERVQLRAEVPRQGFATQLRGRSIAPLVEEMVRIAMAGLRELGSSGGVALLEPLLLRAQERRCPADDILAIWHEVGGNPRAFVEKTRLRID
jgi:glutamate--cysteine ligase